jgi:hypothetical protein
MRATTPAPTAAPTGPGLLALATGLRSRGLRGLDLLGRTSDRAPPGR